MMHTYAMLLYLIIVVAKFSCKFVVVFLTCCNTICDIEHKKAAMFNNNNITLQAAWAYVLNVMGSDVNAITIAYVRVFYNINAPLWHWHYLKIDLQYTSFTCCRQQMNEDDLSLEENGWL